jgi:flagella basal body P-ring formation protein FlgA
MEKMRWFIIGNVIGFGVLIFGIGINESIKHKAAEQPTDRQASPATDQQSGSQTGQNTPASQQARASTGITTGITTGVATGADSSATTPGNTRDANDAKDAKNARSAQNSSDRTNSDSATEDNVKTEARLVTTRDINKGTILHAGDIELRQVDVKRASKDGLTKFDMALGYKTRIDLIEGEMLQPTDLETRETE